jgi:hypothetical protein
MAIGADSREKAWKILIVQEIVPRLSWRQSFTGRQMRSVELSKKTIQRGWY